MTEKENNQNSHSSLTTPEKSKNTTMKLEGSAVKPKSAESSNIHYQKNKNAEAINDLVKKIEEVSNLWNDNKQPQSNAQEAQPHYSQLSLLILQQLDATTKKLEQSENDNSVLIKKQEELQNTISTLENEIKAGKQEKIENIQNTNTISVNESESDFRLHRLNQIEKMANYLYTFQQQNDGLAKEIQTLKDKTQYDSIVKENKELKLSLQEIKTKPIPVCSKCLKNDAKITELNALLHAQTQNEIKKIQTIKQENEETIKSSSNKHSIEITKANQKCKELQAEIESLKTQVMKTQSTYIQLLSSISTSNTHIQELTSKVNELAAKLDKMQSDYTKMETSFKEIGKVYKEAYVRKEMELTESYYKSILKHRKEMMSNYETSKVQICTALKQFQDTKRKLANYHTFIKEKNNGMLTSAFQLDSGNDANISK